MDEAGAARGHRRVRVPPFPATAQAVFTRRARIRPLMSDNLLTTAGELPPAPVAPRRPYVLAHRRRRAHRRLVLAARPRRPRRARVPRGRERLHRGRARTASPRSASGIFEEIRGRVQETDVVGAGAATGRWEYFTAHGRGPAVRRALPPPAGTGSATRAEPAPTDEKVLLDENALAGGPRLLRARRLRARRPTSALLAYSTDHTGGERYDAALPRPRRPAPTSPTSSPTSTTASLGRRQRAPSSTCGPTTRCARTQVWRHALGTAADRRRARVRGGRRALLRRRSGAPAAAGSS